MTLIIIFGILLLIGIGLKIWDRRRGGWYNWQNLAGFIMIPLAGVFFLSSILFWLPHKKENEITYQTLIQEKNVIEKVLETGSDMDKIMLRDNVIEYNNRIIEIKINSKRFILRDYYSKDIDWDSLEFIEWSK